MQINSTTIIALARANWKAGLTVALISTPLSLALSIASGAGPVPGLITAVWATAIAAFLCSSNYNIIGPAGALTTVLFAAVLSAPDEVGPAILPVLAITSGAIIFCIWLAGLDRFLYYIPSSVMYGFAAGVAILIAVSQLFDAAGLSMLERTGSFVGDIVLFARNIAALHTPTLAVFAVFLAFILIWKRFIRALPAVIPAAILGIAFGFAEASYFPLDILSLSDKFGDVTATLFAPPSFTSLISLLQHPNAAGWLLKTSGVIALIAVLETLITAKIADKLTRTQSSARREIFGLSLANIGSGFFGGLPATGVFIRTGANIHAGATHRMSALIAAIFTAVLVIVVFPLFSYLPIAVIAAILVNTAIGLIETEKFKEFWREEKESFGIGILVALITITEDAAIAVLVGAVVALLIYAHKVSTGRFHVILNFPDGSVEDVRTARHLAIPERPIDIVTYGIAGYLGYIDGSQHATNFRRLAHAQNVKAVLIRLRDLFSIDFEGHEMLRDAITELTARGKLVAISSASESIAEELQTAGVGEKTVNNDFTAKASDVISALRGTM
ncbi:MAG: SulP family inorganic anion transporter [Minisyncoccia bacterium]